ncbi:transcription intermediary factor 1-beta-like [Argopecten irradians]|uniref:transcription intermediary factor 1-beta-like n=1 Tax=Argopecten irradians TaxID=31199 RepID=UPI00371BF4D4
MAEGGRPPELDLHLLECPICLERLQQPKSLPCLHSFCQECLGTYIAKEISEKRVSGTSFPCPICRRTTSPVNQSEPKEKWAEQFPTNVVIQDLIQLKERSSELPYCKPCQTKGTLTNPAKFWCKMMNVHFCAHCKEQYHDILHNDCDILDISEYDISKSKPEESAPKCDQHEEKIIWYCEKHQRLGCHVCMIKYHGLCGQEVVMTAKDYLERLQTGTKLRDTKETLKKGAEAMKSLIKDFDEQIQTLVQNQEDVLKSITDLRQRIEKELDECQKAVTDDLVTKYKEEKENIEVSLRQCNRLMKGMLNTMKSSVKAVEENNPMEAIMMYQRGQAEIESCQDLIKDMREPYTSVCIQHQVPKPGTQGDHMLGKIVIEKQRRRFPIDPGFHSLPLSKRQAKEIREFNVSTPADKSTNDICGIVYLPDNNIVVSDCGNKRLKLFTDEGQYLDQLTVPENPYDMCLVDNTTVAVAVWGKGVHVVKVGDKKLSLSSVINTKKNIIGITHRDGRFVVSDECGGVYSITQDGATDLLYKYDDICWNLGHDTERGDILVSTHNNTDGQVAVSRLSPDKRRTDVMKVVVVRGSTGIDIDREGNIYVCGYLSHNVVQMSGDGIRVRELLTSTDGIQNPRTIAVNGEKCVVSKKNITADDRNYIRIFQLC